MASLFDCQMYVNITEHKLEEIQEKQKYLQQNTVEDEKENTTLVNISHNLTAKKKIECWTRYIVLTYF